MNPSKLHVEITADGVRRTFYSEGDGPVVVAAFRAWLASPECELPMAEGADAVDVEASQADEAAQPKPKASEPRRFFPTSTASRSVAQVAPQPTPKQQPRWRSELDYLLMSEAFYPGSGKYTLERLLTCAGKQHTTQDLKRALQNLVLAKRIAVRTVGQHQEWWRLPPNSSSLQAPGVEAHQ